MHLERGAVPDKPGFVATTKVITQLERRAFPSKVGFLEISPDLSTK